MISIKTWKYLNYPINRIPADIDSYYIIINRDTSNYKYTLPISMPCIYTVNYRHSITIVVKNVSSLLLLLARNTNKCKAKLKDTIYYTYNGIIYNNKNIPVFISSHGIFLLNKECLTSNDPLEKWLVQHIKDIEINGLSLLFYDFSKCVFEKMIPAECDSNENVTEYAKLKLKTAPNEVIDELLSIL